MREIRPMLAALAGLVTIATTVHAEPVALRADIEIRRILTIGDNRIRVAANPAEGALYTLKGDGTISRIDLVAETAEILFTRGHHGLGSTQGMAFGADGTLYVTGFAASGKTQVAFVKRGVLNPETGSREWTTVAQTEPYELSDSWYNHNVNAIIVSPDNRFLYVNSGSRTDHGETQDNGGEFPGKRESGLTSAVLRLPIDGDHLILPNDAEALGAAGYLYADGLRNSFDMAFDADGRLFATENGPNRDMPEELNWIREGHHYGFPWRLGTEDMPQSVPGYDPVSDPLLLPSQINAGNGLYSDDPDFPPPPAVEFTDPVLNVGPDADHFRDPETGEVLDASDLGLSLGTFTAHRSPLGLVFDTEGALVDELSNDAFVLSWTPGNSGLLGPMNGSGEDLLHVDLFEEGEQVFARVTRIVEGFSNPIDAEIIGNRIYVIEHGGGHGLWEITLPAATGTAVEELASTPVDFSLSQNFPNPFNPSTTIGYRLDHSGPVSLIIYSQSGQRVRTLVDTRHGSGEYAVRWDGLSDSGDHVASGIYIYRLVSGAESSSRRLVVIK